MFLRGKIWTFPACYSFSMFFVAVLLMGAAGLFGLAADTITHKENNLATQTFPLGVPGTFLNVCA